MMSAGRFYLMVNQILINAEDRWDFNKIWKDCPSKKRLLSIYILLVKLIFGEEPLHTPRKNLLVGNLPYRLIWEDIEVESQRYEN